MNIVDLKECPRCMSDVGFKKKFITAQENRYEWGKTEPGKIILDMEEWTVEFCICCGVAVSRELDKIEQYSL